MIRGCSRTLKTPNSPPLGLRFAGMRQGGRDERLVCLPRQPVSRVSPLRHRPSPSIMQPTIHDPGNHHLISRGAPFPTDNAANLARSDGIAVK